jgi:hypothetical protein
VKSPEGVALTRTSPENTGAPHLEARKAEGRDEGERGKVWLLPGRLIPFYRQTSPLRPEASRAKSPLTYSKVPTL